MKHKICKLVLVSSMALAGCLKVQKKNDQQPSAGKKLQESEAAAPVRPKITRELRISDIEIEYVGLDQPNLYDVVIRWPESSSLLKVSQEKDVIFHSQKLGAYTYTLKNLQGGKIYSLNFEILDQSQHIINSEIKDLNIPQDFYFQKMHKLTQNTEIKGYPRVFMNNSVISTQEFNLKIETKKLIIRNDSVIQNFEGLAKADFGKSGLNGGNIEINAQEAEGHLEIILNGQQGGDGFGGYTGTGENCSSHNSSLLCSVFARSCQGNNGADAGANGNLKLNVLNLDKFKYDYQNLEMPGGVAGPHGDQKIENYPRVGLSLKTCNVKPSNGRPSSLGKICIKGSVINPEQQDCE